MAFISNQSAIHEAQMTCAHHVIYVHLPFFAIRDASEQGLINNPGDQGVCRAERSQEREPVRAINERPDGGAADVKPLWISGFSSSFRGGSLRSTLSGAGKLCGFHFKASLSWLLTWGVCLAWSRRRVPGLKVRYVV